MRVLKSSILSLLFILSESGCFSNAQVKNIENENVKYLHAGNESKGDIAYVRLEAGYADNPASYDPAVIYLETNATCNFDGKYDAYKLLGNDSQKTNFYSFGCDSSKLSINALPLPGDESCRIRLGIKTERDAEINFRIRDLIGDFLYKSISIHDVETGENQSLLYSGNYMVNLKTGHYSDRFYLILSNAINTEVIQKPASDNFKIFSYGGTLNVETNSSVLQPGCLTIYNLSGQPLLQYKIQCNGHHEFNHLLECGIYIATFITGKHMISKRIFIQER